MMCKLRHTYGCRRKTAKYTQTACTLFIKSTCPAAIFTFYLPFRDFKKKSNFRTTLLSFISGFSKEFMLFAKGKFKLTMDGEHYFSK